MKAAVATALTWLYFAGWALVGVQVFRGDPGGAALQGAGVGLFVLAVTAAMWIFWLIILSGEL